jgi:hypothetical protein
LALAAQGPVSAALGRDAPAYRVVALRARNRAQRLGVAFAPDGVTVLSDAARVHLALAGFGYASAVGGVGVVLPRAQANRVVYARAGLREWYANGPLGLEQGFDVAARPAAGRGPLTFSLALSGDARVRRDGHGGMLLSGRGAALRYGGLVASDAQGRTLHSWLELTGGRLLVRVDDRGARYPLRVDPFIQQAELTAGDGAPGDALGSVAVSGNTIVAGAGGHNGGQGAAYVFVMPPSGWANATQTAELTASDGGAHDDLGASVAVSGNMVVVGAPKHVVSGHGNQGGAYVFVMPPSGWPSTTTQTAELTASDGGVGEFFGTSVALSGNAVVVGAPGHTVNGHSSQGAAYVFVMPPSGWPSTTTQTAELTASDGVANDSLGSSVAIAGDIVVAGAPVHTVSGHSGQGAAYLFAMPPGGWGGGVPLTVELTASDGAANDFLGRSVGVSANAVVAGAPFHTVSGHSGQGVAYVFVMPPSGWGTVTPTTAELTASDGAANDNLGLLVAIAGDTVVAGSPSHQVGSAASQGAAYVFVMPPGGWPSTTTQTAELTASDGATNDNLGSSVAVGGGWVVAGAADHNSIQGAAYVFSQPPPTISIASPQNGASYTQGQAVAASYACNAPAGATITACTGPVASGAPIDTSTLGQHSFTGSATDSDGVTASQTVTYNIVSRPSPPPPPQSSPPPPSLTHVTQSRRRWREGNKLAVITSKRRPLAGTRFSFTLNESASVGFAFTQRVSGRQVNSHCVAQTNKNRHKRACTHILLRGALSFTGHSRLNTVTFQGRVSKHKKLKPGRYTLIITATNTAGQLATAKLTFTIVA